MGRAVERVLDCHGFDVIWVQRADEARARLALGGVDALVVDVALPDDPGFALIETARDAGVQAVLLVAAVYRKTSYKRRPKRLYGADDYVEIHHLGDHLPARLRRHLRLPPLVAKAENEALAESERAHEVLEALGDDRLQEGDGARLAEVLVADLLLYNGDAFSVADAQGVRDRLDAQLDAVTELFARLRPDGENPAALVETAFRELLENSALEDAALAGARAN